MDMNDIASKLELNAVKIRMKKTELKMLRLERERC